VAPKQPDATDAGDASGDAEPPLLPDPPPRPPLSTTPSLHHGSLRERLPEVLTADELARLLRINRKTVYAGFRAGDIPGGQRIGGTIRFSRDAVLRWLAEGRASPSPRGAR
jgi:excisionase family DNA binding protein